MIYLDNAATTRICDEALEEMMPFLKEEYASPLGQYALGFRANSALNTARGRVAALIGSLTARDAPIRGLQSMKLS